jgi:hypothetical protein
MSMPAWPYAVRVGIIGSDSVGVYIINVSDDVGIGINSGVSGTHVLLRCEMAFSSPKYHSSVSAPMVDILVV